MSGPILITVVAVLAVAGVIAAVFVVRTRRVVATPTERAVHAALHTASQAARALREGLGPDSARAAAPHLRALTGVEGVVVFDGDAGLLVRDPPDDRIWGPEVVAACERAAQESIAGQRRVLSGRQPAVVAQPLLAGDTGVIGVLVVVTTRAPGPGLMGAGGLVALLLDIKGRTGQSVIIAVVGVLMIVYVLIGGMRGTTWVQIIKAVLLISGAAIMTVMVLTKYGLDFSGLLGSAQSAISGSADEAVANRDVLAPGAQYGASTTSKINLLSLGLALVLGTAGLPHVLMRFYTVPTAKEARRSVVWAIGLIGAFYLFTLALGYGAAAIVGPDRILAAAGGQNSAAPLLAFELGGVILLGVISAVAFATILAVVAGLTITASTSFAHDVYASVMKSHEVTDDEQVKVSRITAVVLGVFAIGLGILANGQNIAFLVALAFAVAAAANLPTIVYSLYWSRFNTRGALWSMYGGLISTIILIVFSPAVSGAKTAMLPNVDFAWFPLANPGIVSIPLAFVLGIAGTLTSPDRGDPGINAEFEVRSLTGVGAEKAIAH